MTFDVLPDRGFRQGAHELVHDFTIAEDLDRRQAANTVLLRKRLLFITVDLDQVEFTRVGRSKVCQDRHQGTAGGTPVRPEINQNGSFLRGDYHQFMERFCVSFKYIWIIRHVRLQ